MNLRAVFAALLLLRAVFSGLFAQTAPSFFTGDTAAAEKYLLWAESAIAANQWAEALAGLERGANFADVSSDISYLLALSRAHEGKSSGVVLQAIEQALSTGRWSRYSESQARLLKTSQLITLRYYVSALDSLSRAAESADAAILRLAALKGLAGNGASVSGGIPAAEFRRCMLEAMDRYPRDSRPLRLLFGFEKQRLIEQNRSLSEGDIALLELAMRRLPYLLESDPDLAWLAAPFIGNDDEARRLLSSYRSKNLSSLQKNGNWMPNPASIPVALNLGLLSDEDAVNELFNPPVNNVLVFEKELLVEVSRLFRSDAGRDAFAQQLQVLNGIVTEDTDADGCNDTRVRYQNGQIQEYSYDADQDGLPDVFIMFKGGVPEWAEQNALPEAAAVSDSLAALPLNDGTIKRILITWESYPAVRRAEFEQTIYSPAPGGFNFTPLQFTEIGRSKTITGLRYPQRDSQNARLSRRSLTAFAVTIQRPSAEFDGAIERIYLDRGVPRRAEEILNDRIVSETAFYNGAPTVQRIDLDLNLGMETIRHFRKPSKPAEDPLLYEKRLESSESDWNGDGIYETAELYLEDGSVVYLWDMDNDGIWEYSETK